MPTPSPQPADASTGGTLQSSPEADWGPRQAAGHPLALFKAHCTFDQQRIAERMRILHSDDADARRKREEMAGILRRVEEERRRREEAQEEEERGWKAEFRRVAKEREAQRLRAEQQKLERAVLAMLAANSRSPLATPTDNTSTAERRPSGDRSFDFESRAAAECRLSPRMQQVENVSVSETAVAAENRAGNAYPHLAEESGGGVEMSQEQEETSAVVSCDNAGDGPFVLPLLRKPSLVAVLDSGEATDSQSASSREGRLSSYGSDRTSDEIVSRTPDSSTSARPKSSHFGSPLLGKNYSAVEILGAALVGPAFVHMSRTTGQQMHFFTGLPPASNIWRAVAHAIDYLVLECTLDTSLFCCTMFPLELMALWKESSSGALCTDLTKYSANTIASFVRNMLYLCDPLVPSAAFEKLMSIKRTKQSKRRHIKLLAALATTLSDDSCVVFNPNIVYHGRWDRKSPAAPVGGWSGVGFEISFSGSDYVSFDLTDVDGPWQPSWVALPPEGDAAAESAGPCSPAAGPAIYKEGILSKQGKFSKHAWKRRWFVLEDHFLKRYDLPERGGKAAAARWARSQLPPEPKKVADLVGWFVTPDPAHGELAFRLTNGPRAKRFLAPDAASYADWMAKLAHAILNSSPASDQSSVIQRRENILKQEFVPVGIPPAGFTVGSTEDVSEMSSRPLEEEDRGKRLRSLSEERLATVLKAEKQPKTDKQVPALKLKPLEEQPGTSQAVAAMASPVATDTGYNGSSEGYYNRDKSSPLPDTKPYAANALAAAANSILKSPRAPVTLAGYGGFLSQNATPCESDLERLAMDVLRDSDSTPEYGSGAAIGDWNLRFQQCIEEMQKWGSQTSDTSKCNTMIRLINLANDFIYAATTFGKIIIAELYIPVQQKSIKPIDLGMAGGDKYLIHNIYFKFARDNKKIYGSDYAASKAGGHELKGCINIFNCLTTWVHGVYIPMMVLVDYRGYRLIAESVLPIEGKETLVYGSADAGKSFACKDEELVRKLKNATKVLNLKKRVVDGKPLYTPLDLEGHRGKDGKLYLVDFARCFPPEFPKDGVKAARYYRLLRPEFVKSYRMSLCPDAFSNFIKDPASEERINADVCEATRYLMEQVIPAFALELPELVQQHGVNRIETFPLTQAMHRRGINMRFLGRVRAQSKDPKILGLLLVEMIARVLKSLLAAKLRKKHEEMGVVAVDQPYRTLCVDFFNLALGTSEPSDRFWDKTLVQALIAKFEYGLAPEEMRPDGMKYSVSLFVPSMGGKVMLFKRLQKMTGVRFHHEAHTQLEKQPERWFTAQPLGTGDIKRIGERVKHLNVISQALGYLYMSRANRLAEAEEFKSAKRFYEMALELFTEALDMFPCSWTLLCHCGEILERIVLLDEAPLKVLPSSNTNVKVAEDFFLRAISTNVLDSMSHYKYAEFLEYCGRFSEADEHYIRSLELDPNNCASMQQYSRFLRLQGQSTIAQRFEARVQSVLASAAAPADSTINDTLGVLSPLPTVERPRKSTAGRQTFHAPMPVPVVPEAAVVVSSMLAAQHSHGQQQLRQQDEGYNASPSGTPSNSRPLSTEFPRRPSHMSEYMEVLTVRDQGTQRPPLVKFSSQQQQPQKQHPPPPPQQQQQQQQQSQAQQQRPQQSKRYSKRRSGQKLAREDTPRSKLFRRRSKDVGVFVVEKPAPTVPTRPAMPVAMLTMSSSLRDLSTAGAPAPPPPPPPAPSQTPDPPSRQRAPGSRMTTVVQRRPGMTLSSDAALASRPRTADNAPEAPSAKPGQQD
eukprot:m51a1_g444 hypothetical protein (1769) ;mRNA; r:86393-107549